MKKIESLLSRGLNSDEELRAGRSHFNNVIDMEKENTGFGVRLVNSAWFHLRNVVL